MNQFFIMLFTGLLSACATTQFSTSALPTSFTTDNVMKVHQGMSANEILQLFGKPKNISQSICGTQTKQPWTCTTWEYGKFPYGRASFIFSGDTTDSLILNNFNVDREQGD